MNTLYYLLDISEPNLYTIVQRFFLTFIRGATTRVRREQHKKKSPSPCYTKLKMIYFHAFAGSTTGWFLVGMNETLFEWMDGGKVGRRRRAGQGGFAAALWEQIIIKRCTRVEEGKTANIKIKLSSYKNLHYWFEVLTCALLSTYQYSSV